MTRKSAGSEMPLTWSDRGDDPRVPLDRATVLREARGYAIVLGSLAVAIALTRAAWPLFGRTPFALLFASVFLSARYATETSSLVGIVAAGFGAGLMVPAFAPPAFQESAIFTFVGVSFVVNRIMMGLNHTEAALHVSEAQFRAVWDNSAFGAALLDARGVVERINPALERTLGLTTDAWRGVSFADFIMVDEAKDARARFATFMAGTESYDRETRFRRADGTTIWGRITMSAVHGADRALAGALMIVEDVSRHRSAEEHTRTAEARFRALFDDVPVALFQSAVDGRILTANRALLRMLGHQSSDALLDLRITDLVATREGQDLVNETLRGGRNLRSLVAPLACRDTLRMVAIEMRAVRNADGAVAHYDGTVVEAPKASIAVPATGV